ANTTKADFRCAPFSSLKPAACKWTMMGDGNCTAPRPRFRPRYRQFIFLLSRNTCVSMDSKRTHEMLEAITHEVIASLKIEETAALIYPQEAFILLANK